MSLANLASSDYQALPTAAKVASFVFSAKFAVFLTFTAGAAMCLKSTVKQWKKFYFELNVYCLISKLPPTAQALHSRSNSDEQKTDTNKLLNACQGAQQLSKSKVLKELLPLALLVSATAFFTLGAGCSLALL
jgi:hypothetical protein